MNKITHDANDAEKEEADRVAANITKLLNEKYISLTPLEFLNIHRHLFEGIFKHAGVAVGHLDIYSKGGKLRRLFIPKNLQGEAKQWLASRDVSNGLHLPQPLWRAYHYTWHSYSAKAFCRLYERYYRMLGISLANCSYFASSFFLLYAISEHCLEQYTLTIKIRKQAKSDKY